MFYSRNLEICVVVSLHFTAEREVVSKVAGTHMHTYTVREEKFRGPKCVYYQSFYKRRSHFEHIKYVNQEEEMRWEIFYLSHLLFWFNLSLWMWAHFYSHSPPPNQTENGNRTNMFLFLKQTVFV